MIQEQNVRQPHRLDLWQWKQLLHVNKLLIHKVEAISLILFPMLLTFVLRAEPASAH